MRAGIAVTRVAAAITKGIKLFDIAELQAGLLGNPGAQADFQRAVGQRVEGTGGQGVPRIILIVADNKDMRRAFVNTDDRGAKADLDGWGLLRLGRRAGFERRIGRFVSRGSPDQVGNLAWPYRTARMMPPAMRPRLAHGLQTPAERGAER